MRLTRKHLTELSIDNKKLVLDLLTQVKSCRMLGKQFNVTAQTISNIKKNAASILEIWEGNCKHDRQRKLRQTPNEEINKIVFEFFQICRTKLIPVSGPLLKEKALYTAAVLGISDFQASNGWLDAFD